jgi:imidazolonepropionase-like amidohydrolase
MRKPVSTATLISALLLSTSAAGQEAGSYKIFEGGRMLGHLEAQQDGQTITIDYQVDENGRGPRTHEVVTLGPAGVPRAWTVSGRSVTGGAATESFEYKSGTARWTSPAERGSRRGTNDRLFIPASASPWSLGLVARYLLKQPGQRADMLPGGTLELESKGMQAVGDGPAAPRFAAYVLRGLDLAPEFILLGEDGQLVAQVGRSQLLMRDDLAGALPALAALRDRLVEEYLGEMGTKLAHRFTVPWHVTNVRVFDPVAERLGPISTVTVFDNRIVSVQQGVRTSVPEGDRLIDGKGGTLMPPLVDMHTHEGVWSAFYRLAAGVTTVRDMGNDNDWLLATAYKRRMGLVHGPRIVRSGFLEGKSPSSAAAGILASSEAEALAAVGWYADHGYSFIKTYNSFDPAWMKPVAAEAHRRGLRIVGHVPAFSTADAMIASGYDEVTHLNQLVLQYVLKPGDDPRTALRLTVVNRLADIDMDSAPIRHTIALMKEHGVGLDTTIALMERFNTQRDGVEAAGDKPYLDHFPVMFQRSRRRTPIAIPDAATDRRHFVARDKLVELIGKMHDAGIKLYPGTDDTVSYSIHRELQLYREAGIPGAEVLRIATLDSIRHLGLDAELGTIEQGKLADFILIPGNPVEDIGALRLVNLVAKDGVLYFPADIYRAYGVKPFSEAPAIQ